MIKNFLSSIKKALLRKKELTIGFYGAPNVGKTTLANRICMDLTGEPIGSVSTIPHETRKAQWKERIAVDVGGRVIWLNILDMPGVAPSVDYRGFLPYNMSKKEAQKRAAEAINGIVEAIRLIERADMALVMADATKEPFSNENIMLLGNLEAREVPIILVANKIDLKDARSKRVRDAFSQYDFVEISASTGENMGALYGAIAKKL